jgi:CubicO group peptidase (beta-lactamase class C family)
MNKISCYLLLLVLLLQHKVFSQEKKLAEKFEQYIRPYVETNNFSGSILISQKGKILFNKAYGFANLEFAVPNDVNTIFHIASISKTFTAAAILLLEQRGLLSTEDALSKYIPDYPSGDKITIHHLLSHTSGITDVNDLPEYVKASLQPQTPETLVALFKNKPLEFQPGEKYEYTSSNYNVLAFIIEQVSKKKYEDFLKENIFKPLGMDHSFHHGNMTQLVNKMAEGYDTDGNFGLKKSPYLDWSSKTGGGSLVSTADDLEKWNKALFGTAILSDKSKNKMFTKYVDAGYGWYLGKQFDKNYIFMNGRSPGFCTHIGRYPEEEICVIVLSNINVFIPKKIAIDLAGILFNQPVEAPAIKRSKITDEELRQLVGKYKFGKDFYIPDFVLEVTSHEGSILSNYGGLIPTKPFEFIQRSYWLKVAFNKDAVGKISGVTIDKYRGEKVE